MIVTYKDRVEIPTERKYDVFAFAGFLAVYRNGMKLRDAVKAIMAIRGTTWVQEMEEKYPVPTALGQRRVSA